MKALAFLVAAGVLGTQAQVASAGNINPMSQRYNATSVTRHPTARQEQKKAPRRQRQGQPAQQGGSQY
ncbi:MAG: hypothetical protein H6872_03915 [Methylobacteriaceae bacterium]|nr:hypothetical protein [Methylobacteriaceae bacterium]